MFARVSFPVPIKVLVSHEITKNAHDTHQIYEIP